MNEVWDRPNKAVLGSAVRLVLGNSLWNNRCVTVFSSVRMSDTAV